MSANVAGWCFGNPGQGIEQEHAGGVDVRPNRFCGRHVARLVQDEFRSKNTS